MSFEHVQFLSGWVRMDHKSMAMTGRKATLEIENSAGDFLIFEYAYPGREEECGISVTIRVFDTVVGQFRGFYSFPFYGRPDAEDRKDRDVGSKTTYSYTL